MKNRWSSKKRNEFLKEAQSMIEYVLLLGATVVVVLLAFKSLLPNVRNSSNIYYNKVAVGVMGDMAARIENADGNWHKARSYYQNYP